MFKIKNKKASASAITWVPATFLIVFLMLIHLMFSGILYTGSENRINIGLDKSTSNLKIDDLESFMAFLKTPISEKYSGVEAARAGGHGGFQNSEEIKKAVNSLNFDETTYIDLIPFIMKGEPKDNILRENLKIANYPILYQKFSNQENANSEPYSDFYLSLLDDFSHSFFIDMYPEYVSANGNRDVRIQINFPNSFFYDNLGTHQYLFTSEHGQYLLLTIDGKVVPIKFEFGALV